MFFLVACAARSQALTTALIEVQRRQLLRDVARDVLRVPVPSPLQVVGRVLSLHVREGIVRRDT